MMVGKGCGVDGRQGRDDNEKKKTESKKKVYIRNLGHAQQQKSATRVPRKTRKKREHQQRASNKFHLLLMGVCLYARDYKCIAFRENKKKIMNTKKKLYYKLQNFFANGRLDAIKFISVCGIDELTFSA